MFNGERCEMRVLDEIPIDAGQCQELIENGGMALGGLRASSEAAQD